MPPPGLLLHPLSSSSSIIRPSNSISFDFFPSKRRKYHSKSLTCKASSSSTSSFSVTDFDLYDLLGIDNTSNQSQIKTAYRSLQKKCHPDIAGPSGHDMAIILNDVYSILSDPASRAAYDEEQAKMEEFEGYSGKPLYSRWFGSESEERAVFVDEVKCVGCLKCALVAEKTFAIESVYGRARVVAQWADSEDKILDAMQACPVDCISMVERSNLATLEFLMSKQPRGKVGAPVGKGMIDVKKFQSKLQQAKNKESIQDPRETAFHTIRSISNWFYWQSPMGDEQRGSLVHIAGKSSPFNTEKLRDAAAAAKQGNWAPLNGARKHKDDIVGDKEIYWTPTAEPIGPVTVVFENLNPTAERPKPKSKPAPKKVRVYKKDDGDPYRLRWTFPLVIATFASTIVRLQVQGGSNDGIEQHMVAGPLPLEIVNSTWLQAILAGCTWYLIAFVSVGFVRALINRPKM